MATILFTSMSSVRAHHLRGAVRWEVLKRITPGILAGGLAGSLAAGFVSTRGLALFFALLVYAVGANMLRDHKPKATRDLPGPLGVGAHLNLDKSEPPAEYRVADRAVFG